MEQAQAISLLNNQISEIISLKTSYTFSSVHTHWGLKTTQILEEIFGKSSGIYRNFMALSWESSGPVITRGFEDIQGQLNRQRQIAYINQLDTAKGILEAGISLIQRKGIENVYEEKIELFIPKKVLTIIPVEVKKNIETMQKCYSSGAPEACPPFIRKALSTAITLKFKMDGKSEKIRDNTGEPYGLPKQIELAKQEGYLSSSLTKKLSKVKLFGDIGIHDYRIDLQNEDVVPLFDLLRLSLESIYHNELNLEKL